MKKELTEMDATVKVELQEEENNSEVHSHKCCPHEHGKHNHNDHAHAKHNHVHHANCKHNHGHHGHGKHRHRPHVHRNKRSSLFNSTFLHLIGDFFQDIGLLIVSVILMFRPNWDIIDPIISIIVSVISKPLFRYLYLLWFPH